MTIQPPRTLREKYSQQREELYTIRAALNGAINDLLAGELVTTYAIGNRSRTVTTANLKDLQDSLKNIDARIDEIEAILSGRPIRSTQTHSYIQPAATWFDISGR